MTEAEAIRILNEAANAPRKIEAFERLAKQLGAPLGTVYHWWKEEHVPSWRLSAFAKIRRKR